MIWRRGGSAAPSASTRPAIFEAVVSGQMRFEAVVSGQMRLKYYDSAQYHDVVARGLRKKKDVYATV